jgi:hypothetical protein
LSRQRLSEKLDKQGGFVRHDVFVSVKIKGGELTLELPPVEMAKSG